MFVSLPLLPLGALQASDSKMATFFLTGIYPSLLISISLFFLNTSEINVFLPLRYGGVGTVSILKSQIRCNGSSPPKILLYYGIDASDVIAKALGATRPPSKPVKEEVDTRPLWQGIRYQARDEHTPRTGRHLLQKKETEYRRKARNLLIFPED